MTRLNNFVVYGEPVAKGRPRMTKSGHAFTPERTVNYENFVKWTYAAYENRVTFDDEAQIRACMRFYFPIPKSTSKKNKELMRSGKIRPTKKPDVDNCVKAILDALNGLAYHDDSQVVEVEALKFYSEEPRVEIQLTTIEDEINGY